MDADAVRTLAARVEAVARALEADAAALGALRSTPWVGPAATVCALVLDERLAAARALRADLGEAAAALRAHATSVDAALVALRAVVAGGGAAADVVLRGGAASARPGER